jgi:uncharacterized membrane protein YoaK (UPF0700 family)
VNDTSKSVLRLTQANVADDFSGRRKDRLISMLGVMSGLSWVLCQRRFGMFTNMMSGNMSRFANALADSNWKEALFYLSLVFSYTLGVCIFRVFDLDRETPVDEKTFNLPIPRGVVPAAVAVFVLADLVDLSGLPAGYMLSFLSIGFGIINTISQTVIGSITNAATGHLTRVGLGVVDSLVLGVPLLKTRGTSIRFIGAFLTSVLATSILYNRIAASGLTLPPMMGSTIGILYAVLLTWYSGAMAPGSERVRIFLYTFSQRLW